MHKVLKGFLIFTVLPFLLGILLYFLLLFILPVLFINSFYLLITIFIAFLAGQFVLFAYFNSRLNLNWVIILIFMSLPFLIVYCFTFNEDIKFYFRSNIYSSELVSLNKKIKTESCVGNLEKNKIIFDCTITAYSDFLAKIIPSSFSVSYNETKTGTLLKHSILNPSIGTYKGEQTFFSTQRSDALTRELGFVKLKVGTNNLRVVYEMSEDQLIVSADKDFNLGFIDCTENVEICSGKWNYYSDVVSMKIGNLRYEW